MVTSFISVIKASFSTSLLEAWTALEPPSIGILDQLNEPKENIVKITASTYLPQQSRLVVGRDDGSIIIVPATQVIAIHLLKGPHQLKGRYIVYISKINNHYFSLSISYRMANASNTTCT